MFVLYLFFLVRVLHVRVFLLYLLHCDLQCFFKVFIMANDSKAAAVRSLTAQDVDIVLGALSLYEKSQERAARASSNPVIASEYSKLAGMSRNLAAHFRNGSLDF